MAVANKHVLQQGPVLATLAHAAWTAMRQQLDARLGHSAPSTMPPLPSPEVAEILPPRAADLVRDYIRNTGGDPSAYRGTVPAHMFPQWGFPLSARTLEGIPYPLVRVLNGGCRLQMNAPLPADAPLHVRARLEDIDDNGRRAVLHQRVITGTEEHPEAVIADLFAIVPLAKKDGGNGAPREEKKPVVRVPEGAEELARWKLAPGAGLDFAKLTGDFNPVHWIRPYARAAGFRSTILHGFATLARTIEGLQRTMFAGSVHALAEIDVKFTKPLVLPAKVGLYVRGDEVWVGDAPGGPAYLAGKFVRTSGAST
ncbi:MAG: MaoC/PaaZ C-terminal domain-containing protein [Nannocystaceae bacterium]|jgi:acyl dehydratase